MTWERRKPLRRSPLNPGSAPLRGVPLQRGGGLRSRRDREERDEPTGVTSPTTNGPAPRRRASTIRQLQRGEAVPTSTPRRYPNRDGYIRLRWKVGIQQYVEVYEHRVVDGIVTDAEHVHHDNLVRHDNEPGNLVELTADEHNQLHADMRRGQRTYGPYRSKSAKAKAERAQARRAELAEQVAEMRRLYLDEKLSAGQIGQRIGIDPSNVSRRLRAAGVRMRPAVGISDERQRTVPRKTSYKRTGETRARKLLKERSGGVCEGCGKSRAHDWAHRVAQGQGGPWCATNGLALCRPCHGWSHLNPAAARELGWMLRSTDDPATYPAEHARFGRVLLRADGTVRAA